MEAQGGEARLGRFNTLIVSLPIQGRAIINRATKRCLEIKKVSSYYVPVLRTCTTQVWTIQHTLGHWGSN